MKRRRWDYCSRNQVLLRLAPRCSKLRSTAKQISRGLNFWMWNLKPDDRFLDIAIEEMGHALVAADRVLQQKIKFPVGRCAQGHLKLLFMLRMHQGQTRARATAPSWTSDSVRSPVRPVDKPRQGRIF